MEELDFSDTIDYKKNVSVKFSKVMPINEKKERQASDTTKGETRLKEREELKYNEDYQNEKDLKIDFTNYINGEDENNDSFETQNDGFTAKTHPIEKLSSEQLNYSTRFLNASVKQNLLASVKKEITAERLPEQSKLMLKLNKALMNNLMNRNVVDE